MYAIMVITILKSKSKLFAAAIFLILGIMKINSHLPLGFAADLKSSDYNEEKEKSD